ncbi:DNA-3-methyladenine glycosylase [Caloranaerobacter sp. TR13]|uniref:DNA-3-methyladenine glycosylase I n=1 Tax=Caloranaerobacter sp. TR13 TaxID=1302151 RepID=UPI0006D48EB2|nr:DNA-3-methyladenine glycosylase I [Caloranaerobacter sp. TR13]KPU27188.1 DNA-3-methyladenine glycosylase [Caloranaerobacter sp. TR13]
MKKRCGWVTNDPIYVRYHDEEWGVPIHDDGKLFEFLVLETFQAGLSWITILKKRENFRKAFDNFDPVKISNYDENKIEELMKNKGIIRNRKKIEAVINNAKAFLKIQKEFGSFDKYLWQFVGNKPIVNSWTDEPLIPSKTELSEKISKDLKKRGFKFFGPTICYAHMQAVGMVNDHITNCFRYKEIIEGY